MKREVKVKVPQEFPRKSVSKFRIVNNGRG